MKFLASTLIWMFASLPMTLLGFFVVPFLLLTKWEGTTGWWGNFKYGRGDTHYKAPSNGNFFKQWRFLAWRNPCSNFGKKIISVKEAPWVWLYDQHVFGWLWWKYGWKEVVVENGDLRTFVWRPHIERT